jgi:hypothetical protein
MYICSSTSLNGLSLYLEPTTSLLIIPLTLILICYCLRGNTLRSLVPFKLFVFEIYQIVSHLLTINNTQTTHSRLITMGWSTSKPNIGIPIYSNRLPSFLSHILSKASSVFKSQRFPLLFIYLYLELPFMGSFLSYGQPSMGCHICSEVGWGMSANVYRMEIL